MSKLLVQTWKLRGGKSARAVTNNIIFCESGVNRVLFVIVGSSERVKRHLQINISLQRMENTRIN
jgi:hypothetical protein